MENAKHKTAKQAITHEEKIELLSKLLISDPQKLVAVGLGEITAGELAAYLLKYGK